MRRKKNQDRTSRQVFRLTELIDLSITNDRFSSGAQAKPERDCGANTHTIAQILRPSRPADGCALSADRPSFFISCGELIGRRFGDLCDQDVTKPASSLTGPTVSSRKGMVARTGLEPVLSALRGRRVN